MEKIKSLLGSHSKDADTTHNTGRLETDPEGAGAAKNDNGIARQILNPGGNKYDETRYGTTAHSNAPLSEPTTGTTTGQGLSGSGLGGHGQNPPTSTDRSFPLSGGQNTSSSHDGTDSGLAGGAGGAGLGARDRYTDNNNGALASGRDDLSGPMSGLSVGDGSTSTQSPLGNSSSVPGTQNLPHGSESHLGRDAGIVGAAGGLGALGSSSENPSSPSGIPSARDIPGDTFGYHNENEKPVEGYVHHVPGPHATDIANRLDPHVPGEFPDASGLDRHLGRETGAANAGELGASGVGAAALARDQPTSSSLDPNLSSSVGGSKGPAPSAVDSSQHPHHYGRDAGIAGGVGAAGLGAYEVNKLRDHDTAPGRSLNSTLGSAPPTDGSSAAGSTSGLGAAAPPSSSSNPMQSATNQEHHYGRDAGIAGGVGAAGIGAYEANKLQDHRTAPSSSFGNNTETVPGTSSGAIAPTSTSSAAGIDPRSSRDPSQSHHGRDAALAGGSGAVGAGAYETSKNRKDPQDQLSSSKYQEPAHSSTTSSHHGRDAALGGGAGAVGAGAYEASKDRKDPQDQSSTSKYQDPAHSSAYSQHETAIAPHDLKEKLHSSTGAESDAEREHNLRVEREKHARMGTMDDSRNRDGSLKGHESAFGQHETANAPQVLSSQLHEDPTFKPTHAGRDAALIGGGVGAAGLGTYEAEKHTGHQGTQEDLHQQGHNKLHKKNDPRDDPAYNAKHEHDLQKARAKESKVGGDHGHDGEKKEGFLHKLLHHGDKDKHAHEKETAAAAGVGGAAGGSSALGGSTSGSTAESNIAAQHASEKYGQPMTYDHGTLAPAPGTGPTKDGVLTQPGTGETQRLPTESGNALPDFSHEHTGTTTGSGLGSTGAGYSQSGVGSGLDGADSGLGGSGSGIGGAERGLGGAGTSNSGVVTEPRTGLPMNVGKYGTDGAGGTDGGPISGLNQDSGAADWDKVKKLNTPY